MELRCVAVKADPRCVDRQIIVADRRGCDRVTKATGAQRLHATTTMNIVARWRIAVAVDLRTFQAPVARAVRDPE
jgi:hypothetical protein